MRFMVEVTATGRIDSTVKVSRGGKWLHPKVQ